ncbi:MAG: hypothetical protein GC164_14065 [Phycisphaera sp.]|nr:hypothetical protein [Phycisphaera sp.]
MFSANFYYFSPLPRELNCCHEPAARVRVSVPENPKPEELLIDALRENLSPEAVAAIHAWLQPASTKHANINTELEWFRTLLRNTVGGTDAMNRLMDEVGL